MPAHAAPPPQAPLTLGMTVWAICGVPALIGAVLAAASLQSALAGTGATRDQALRFLPFLLTFFGAVAAYIVLRRATSAGQAWLCSTLTGTLLLVGALPVTLSLGGALVSEWCEDAPGGRGYSPSGAAEEVPWLCR
ncbi:hypothetical protein [Arthrobacter sp. zg-Y1110]|uniref:hypothetical protein n=1 Tax=Arthrobacter sp. zg-Y1110 TaxID=2886932 RepID=UPI001D144A04|nr:hypothetical protein [Arthrobacter sp. zg-Y1110]MCC3289779.1 hypothetical protein [Arthrobacter sp. zg-Y1110]UWX84804.1 hypothetical protein N2K99_15320 [Arthrobacter sp. zg-Y1110]